ncbi:ABC transporter permease [Halorientalis marina]|jgi:ABC-2 type transport system permease protein|uniref:ABC transporter permease n=1 Tax=Halorientalis marina TaxID=2931976 RepID=UPI001FF2A838|nr:ABC transporter permease [Halorientalis marina]
MTVLGRVASSFTAASRSFLRRRTAVFFTFFFPVIIILIFGAVVQTDATGSGLFTEPAGYYVPGYLAVVVLFTPLSRVGSEVARHRDGNQFEKLATTPLSRPEWLLAQTLVNVVVIGLAGLLLLALIVVVTGAEITFSPLLVPFVAFGVALFCGVGALLGSLADSQDGVIAASNGIALPLLFLSETFVPPVLLPDWLPTELSPLTYFSWGVRSATFDPASAPLSAMAALGVLAALTVVFFAAGAYALPTTD